MAFIVVLFVFICKVLSIYVVRIFSYLQMVVILFIVSCFICLDNIFILDQCSSTQVTPQRGLELLRVLGSSQEGCSVLEGGGKEAGHTPIGLKVFLLLLAYSSVCFMFCMF